MASEPYLPLPQFRQLPAGRRGGHRTYPVDPEDVYLQQEEF
jgi:hypothetical protein